MSEQPLRGGNRSTVVRIGDTVRRKRTPQSAAVRVLLDHLEGVGFEHSPRFLGVDECGRDTLTYVPGTVGNYPMHDAIRTDRALETAATILRRFHDATVGLRLPDGYADHSVVEPDVICHWDAAPYNFVFGGDRALSLIDFDEAGPGRRIDDLAYFAYRFAPLCSEESFADGGWTPDVDRFGRLARIFEIYPDDRAASLPDVLAERLSAMEHDPRTPPAHAQIYRRDGAFVRQCSDEIRSVSS